MASAYERFLGVRPTADAYALLQLTPGQAHPTAVQRALQNQLARVDRHPDSSSSDAKFIREQLHAAARAVLTGVPQQVGRQPGASQPAASATTAAAAAPRTVAPVPLRPRFDEPPAREPAGPQRGNGVHTRLALTDFDRQVLAILIASGGWNRESRARLIALATAHRVSPAGLMKVVRGLGDYASSHGETRLDTSQVIQGKELRMDVVLPPAPRTEEGVHEWRREIEHQHGGAWATVKLSMLFGVATLLLGSLFVNTLFNNRDAASTNQGERGESSRDDDAGALPLLPEQPMITVRPEGAPRLAEWPQPPTFYADASPDAAAEAADQSPRLPDRFDELSRRLMVTEEPDQEFFDRWRDLNEQAALAWPLMDQVTFHAVRDNVLKTLYAAADRPTVSDRMIELMSRVSARDPIEPLDLWRGVWATGMLGAIAGRSDGPLLLRQVATRRLDAALRAQAEPDVYAFGAAGRQWLGSQITPLVERSRFDDAGFDYWELWIVAQRALKEAASFDNAIMDAIEAVMATSVDLGRPGRLTDVLGRLLTTADFLRSPVVKDRILRMHENSDYDARDLWVLGSMLAQYDAAPWFEDAYVVADGATLDERLEKQRLLERRWPQLAIAQQGAAAGRGVLIDAELGSRWMHLAEGMIREASAGISTGFDERDLALLERLVVASWLNEAAAALAAQDHRAASDVIHQIELGWFSNDDPTGTTTPNTPPNPTGPGGERPERGGENLPITPPTGGGGGGLPITPGGPGGAGGAPIGQSVGADGPWAQSYAAARSAEERLELIRSMRSTMATDLGVQDAAAFVREAYRGVPAAVRDEAQFVLLELFKYGPNVAVALVNHFADAPEDETTADFITELTGQLVPAPRSANWEVECRRALTDHALRLLETSFNEMGDLQHALAESYADQHAHLRPGLRQIDFPRDPLDGVSRVMAAMREDASTLMIADPAPASLATIDRRHGTRLSLANSSLERAVATQIAVLDTLAYIVVAEQPILREEVMEVLDRAAANRAMSKHILEQAIHLELAQAELWLKRLALRRAGVERIETPEATQ